MSYLDLISEKKFTEKSAWFVFILCSVIMGIMSHFSGWSVNVIAILSFNAVAISIMTFHPKISVEAQSLALTICSFVNIFTCSLMENDIYPSISVFIGAAILISSYKRAMLLVIYLSLIIGGLLFHIFGAQSVSFDTSLDKTLFIVRVSVMLVAQLYLIFIIKGINKTTTDLEESAAEARRAERYKSDFLANMSHEIRTPMNAIIGMCELILRESDISEGVRENCFNIQTSGRSLLSIINDILDFSKIESGKMELVYDEFNIASTLNDVINMTEARKGDKPIELLVNASPDIPRGLIGDEVRLRQIMINIMTNAVKFTERGSVTLTVSCTRQEYGINLLVSVTDTGIGITEENIEKLFTSFRQVDTKKNRAVEGTGLGLAISKRLVTSMGGFISVKSEYGVGTEFKFVIPMKVSDPLAFVSVKEPQNIRAGIFFAPCDEALYKPIFDEMSDKMAVDFRCFTDFGKFAADNEKERFTHAFVSREHYLENETALAELSKNCHVFIVQSRMDSIKPSESIGCVYKPFYSMSVACALNNESLALSLGERRNADIRFTAPKARVLIVDDNPINLKVAVGLMRPYNMQLITAQSGPAAINMLRSADIDLVFMDHMMPEMDGVEATKIIRSNQGEYYKNLPIVALTANAVNGAREMFMSCGFNDFLAKPIELSALDKILRNYLPKEYIRHSEGSSYGKNDRRGQKAPAASNALFDSEKGLSYTGGDVETYREILSLYARKSKEKRDYIAELFDKNDWKNYIIEVHALKSTSLSIGAVRLSELAKELEAAGKAESYGVIERKNSALLKLYEQTELAVYDYLGESAKEESAEETAAPQVSYEEISQDELKEYLNRALEACDMFDAEALSEISEKTAGFTVKGTALADYFKKAAELAEDFEYDAAKELVLKLQSTVREEE